MHGFPVWQVPDWQLPDAEQVVPPVHAAHAAPPVPQDELLWLAYATQEPPLQQPEAQVLELQLPPWHIPVALQVAPPEHAAHAAPPVPQVLPFWLA